MVLLIFIFSILFVITSIYIWKKSPIFFLAYMLLFIYTIFTQLGYVFYPEELNIVSHYQYYGQEAFYKYWVYIFFSFISIFLLFVILYDKKYRTMLRIEVSPLREKTKDLLYIVSIFLYEITLVFFLIISYSSLSYYSQAILKSNKIFFYLFDVNGIILLSIIYKICIEHSKMKKVFYLTIFIASLSIFLIIAIRTGQRIEIGTSLLSFITFILFISRDKTKKKYHKKKYIIVLLILGFIAIALSQGIRTIRGYNESPIALLYIITKPRTYISLFEPKNLIFQDYINPSLTLITSMERDIVFTTEVIESNVTCLIPFISHYSLGDILSRIIDPEGWAGYGYYILTEGYNFVGFVGFIYSAFIFVVGFRFLESFFANTYDRLFNAYMYAIIAFLSLSIVRGQSVSFLKGLYMYFLLAILLFRLMSGQRVFLVYRRRPR